MKSNTPSLSYMIEQIIPCSWNASASATQMTFLQWIRRDVARMGGWSAQGDTPPILAFSGRVAHEVAFAGLINLARRNREFPSGIRSVFTDWWAATPNHAQSDVEKIAVLSCARALMSVDVVKQGDRVWNIAQHIARSMGPDARIAAMQEAFALAGACRDPERASERKTWTANLLATGHWCPQIHEETQADGWRMVSACIHDLTAANGLISLRTLPMDLGAPGPEFYRHLPATCESAALVLRMARGVLHQGLDNPVRRVHVAETMLSDLGEWVRSTKPTGQLDNESFINSWAKLSRTPLFAPLEPVAMEIIMACNVAPACSPPRPGPRL